MPLTVFRVSDTALARTTTTDHRSYMRHTILAPSPIAANKLAASLRSAGHDARHAVYQTHVGERHVVLAFAPTAVVNAACQRESFVPGLSEGFNAR